MKKSRKLIMKKFFLIAATLFTGVIIIIYFFYMNFRNERLNELTLGSEVIETSHGIIEYQITGESGPVILFLHGTTGGYDSGFSWPGCRVLTVSGRVSPYTS